MKSGPIFKVAFKRRREQKTDYKKRLAVLKSKQDRFVLRVTNSLVKAQIIRYDKDGDKTVVSATSRELVVLGYTGALKNTPAVYLTALLLSAKAKKANIKEVIYDLGAKNYKSGNKIFAGLKAIVDSGLVCPYNEKAFPTKDRIEGKTMAEYLKKPVDKEFTIVKEKILKM
ncbi:MAG: 50S ribosomal protein L18 [archaeon]|jgi:large subunit ribosomal protein L18